MKANLENLERRPFESEKRDEHENQENTTGQLKVLFRLVLAEAGNSGEKWFTIGSGFGQDEKQSTDQCQVPEEELHVPKDAVGDGLKIHKKIINKNFIRNVSREW
jgi:hypothetical protein